MADMTRYWIITLPKTSARKYNGLSVPHQFPDVGVSAQTDLYLLRNNKWLQTQTNAQALRIRIREHLHHRKFEFERLEQSYRNSVNGE